MNVKSAARRRSSLKKVTCFGNAHFCSQFWFSNKTQSPELIPSFWSKVDQWSIDEELLNCLAFPQQRVPYLSPLAIHHQTDEENGIFDSSETVSRKCRPATGIASMK
jgi:hypothetical protein